MISTSRTRSINSTVLKKNSNAYRSNSTTKHARCYAELGRNLAKAGTLLKNNLNYIQTNIRPSRVSLLHNSEPLDLAFIANIHLSHHHSSTWQKLYLKKNTHFSTTLYAETVTKHDSPSLTLPTKCLQNIGPRHEIRDQTRSELI